MSFKSFSNAQATPAKDKADDKAADAPAKDQLAAKSDKAIGESAPSSKS